MTPKTCDNHGQIDKQTEFIKKLKREQISLRAKLVISYNWGTGVKKGVVVVGWGGLVVSV